MNGEIGCCGCYYGDGEDHLCLSGCYYDRGDYVVDYDVGGGCLN